MAEKVIGKIVVASGEVLIHRDGKTIVASVGTELLQGDMISTSGDGKAGIAMIDDSRFSLGAKASMKLDELTFNDTTKTGTMTTSVVKGAFMFVTGSIAKSPGDKATMKVRTSSATIAVRGTEVVGDVQSNGTESKFTLLPNADGHKSFAQIENAGGVITIDQPNQTVGVTGFFAPPSEPYQMSPSAVAQTFGQTLLTMNQLSLAMGLPVSVNQATYTPPTYVAPTQIQNDTVAKTASLLEAGNPSIDQLLTKIEASKTKSENLTIERSNAQAIDQQQTVFNAVRQLSLSELIAIRSSVNSGYVFAETKVVTTIGGNIVTFYAPSFAALQLNIPPSAAADIAAATEIQLTPTRGNVLTNDTDVDAFPNALSVLAYNSSNMNNTPGALGSIVSGQFGSLSIASSGSYTYVIDTGKSQVYNSSTTGVVNDVFNYTISDGSANATSTVSFTVDFTSVALRSSPTQTYSSAFISTSTDTVSASSGDILSTSTVVSGTYDASVVVSNFNTNSSFVDSLSLTANITAGNQITGTYGTLTLNPSGTYEYILDPTKTDFISTGIASVTRSGTTATITANAHGYTIGDRVTVDSSSNNDLDGTYTITGVTTNTFTYTTVATGTISSTADTGTITSGIASGTFVTDDFTYKLSNGQTSNFTIMVEGVGTAGIADLVTYTYRYGDMDPSTAAYEGDYYTGYVYVKAGTYDQYMTGVANANKINTLITENGKQGYYTIDSVTQDQIGVVGLTRVNTYYDTTKGSFVTPYMRGLAGLGSEEGTVAADGRSDVAGTWVYDYANYFFDADLDVAHAVTGIQYYTFTYNYGNGEFYTGYGYASAGTYAANTTKTSSTITGIGEGSYYIEKVFTIEDTATDNIKVGDVYVSSYYDAKGAGDNIGALDDTIVNASGERGLGSERGNVFSKTTGAADAFDAFSQATISASTSTKELYYFHYEYVADSGSNDTYYGYGYATAGTYSVNQTLTRTNELGATGRYTIDAKYSSDVGSVGEVFVTNYYDADMSGEEKGAGWNTIVEGTGLTGLGSEEGNVRNALTGKATDSFSNYYEADVITSAGTLQEFYYHFNYGSNKTISNVQLSGTTATITTSAAHGYAVGDTVIVAATTNKSLNGSYTITGAPTTTTFTYTTTTSGTISSGADTGTSSDITGYDTYYGYGTAASGTYAVGAITTTQATAIQGEAGIYTIDAIYGTTFGVAGEVYVTSYNDSDGAGWNTSANASGTLGLGSEKGTISNYVGSKLDNFNPGDDATLSTTGDALQTYYYHFTYTTGGDIYYGYGTAARGTYAVGDITNAQATAIKGEAGTYTIDKVYESYDGTAGEVQVYSYYDAGGLGWNNTVKASSKTGLGTESGAIFDYNGDSDGFDVGNDATISTITNSGTALQLYYYHFTYTSGDTYYGYGYKNYTTTTGDGSSPYTSGQTLSSSITNVAVTSNVATITTSTAHGYTTGDRVTVDSSSNNTLDGTYTITGAPTTTTFTYAKTAADSSTVDTGTIKDPTLTGTKGTYTIDWVYDTTYGTAGEVQVYAYYDADTGGIGWNNTVSGSGKTGLGSESGTITNYAGKTTGFTTDTEADFIATAITNVAVTSNVATITTSTAHGYKTGDRVTVDSSSNNTLDGTYTITGAPTTTTFTYAKTADDSSTVDTGTVADPTLKLYYFHFTYTTGDTYYGYGYTETAYTSGQTLASVIGTKGTYTIDWVYDTTYGTAGEVNIYSYYDADGVYWDNTVSGSGKSGLGSEEGNITNYSNKSTGFTTASEADFIIATAITNVAVTSNVATITTSTAHGYTTGDRVTVDSTSNNTFDGTYTITGAPTTTTFTYALTATNSSSADTGTVAHPTLKLYYFHFTYTTGDTYYGYGYTDSAYTTATSVTPTGAKGTYTIDWVYDTTYGTAGEVQVYAYYDADTGGIGWNNTVSGSGKTGLGSESGTITDYKEKTTGFSTDTEADFIATAITNVAVTSNVATITTSTAHGYKTGDRVTVDSSSNNTFDGTYTITGVPDTTTFTYALTTVSAGTTNSTTDKGTVTDPIVQLYYYHFTYTTGDTYYGYGYKNYTTTTGDGSSPYTSGQTLSSSISSVSRSDTTATITAAAHGYTTGDRVTVDSSSNNTLDGTYTITGVTTNTFTYTTASSGTISSTADTGTIKDPTLTGTLGTYTIDWVYDTTYGTAGEVNIYSYYDADGVYWDNTVSGSGKSGLGSEEGNITNYSNKSTGFTTASEADFVAAVSGATTALQLYYYHFTYTTGDTYYGYGYKNYTTTTGDGSSPYTSGQTLSSSISSVSRSDTTATITAAAHGYTTGDRVTVDSSSNNTLDGTYTITGVTTNTFTYTTTSSGTISSTVDTGTIKDPTLTGTKGTYTIDWVYDTTYGTAGEVNVYAYYDADTGGIGWNNTVSGSGKTGLGSESGTITDYKEKTTGFTTDTEADFIATGITFVSRSGTTVTITAAAHGYKTGDRVTVDSTSNNTLDGTYTITGVTTDTFTYTTTSSGTISSTADTGTIADPTLKLYYFHFTYTTGDTYYGYGYTDSAYTTATVVAPIGAKGTYTIDWVYDTTYGTAGEVNVYSYYDADTGGIGWNNTVSGSGKTGLGSESGILTNYAGKTTGFTTDSEADFIATGITFVSRSGTTVTITAAAHGYKTGDRVTVDSTSNNTLDGTYTITGVTTDTFTYTTTSSGTISSTADTGTIADPTLKLYYFHFTYTTGDTYYGYGYTDSAYTTSTVVAPIGALGIYTIDWVYDTTYGTAGEVNVYAYYDADTDGIGWNNTVSGSGKSGLGSEEGTITNYKEKTTGFTTASEADFVAAVAGATTALQLYYYHFTYTSGDTYYGYGYKNYTTTTGDGSSPYTSGQTLSSSISSVSRSATTATITANAHGYTTGDRVTVDSSSNNDLDGTYTITGVTTNTFTYTTTSSGTISSTVDTGTIKDPTLTGTKGTYTIDWVYDTTYGTAGEVNVYAYYDADTGGIGWNNTVSGSGKTGLGSESGTITDYKEKTTGFTTDSEADFIATGITFVSRSGTTVTITAAAHGYKTGDRVTVDSTSNNTLDGTYTITGVTTDTFTYTTTSSGTISSTADTGTIADPTLKLYYFHFTYTTGDTYYGYGYTDSAYTTATVVAPIGAKGTYTIDWVYDTTYGTAGEVNVYSYYDADTGGIGWNNTVSGSGKSGLGSEEGKVTSSTGLTNSFTISTEADFTTTSATLQIYYFHFTYTSGDTYYGYGTTLKSDTTYAVGNITSAQAAAISGEAGTYTIDYVYDTTSGTAGEVQVYSYYDADTGGIGWNNMASGSGYTGLGSESGSVTSYDGLNTSFTTSAEADFSSANLLQYYQFHFTYNTTSPNSGDVYYGYGYAAANTYAVGNITSDQATAITGENGTYTIDYVYSSNKGTKNEVTIYSYYDTDGVYWDNTVSASGLTGLGSESGSITNLAGSTATFTTASEADFVTSNTTLQYYQFHFTYNTTSPNSGDIYYGYGYAAANTYAVGNLTDAQTPAISGEAGIYTIDYVYASTWGTLNRVSIYQYYDADTGVGAGYNTEVHLEKTITQVARSGTTATITTSGNHGYAVGDYVYVADTSSSSLNGYFQITSVSDATHFSFTSSASGTISTSSSGGTCNNWVAGISGLGSESGRVVNYNNESSVFTPTTEADFINSSVSTLQYYNFHFTYTSGGDVYYGYGYVNKADVTGGAGYTSGQTFNNSTATGTTTGTYVIDYVQDGNRAWGSANEVHVYSYYDADGVGWSSGILGAGTSSGLGYEIGWIFDWSDTSKQGIFTSAGDADLSIASANSSLDAVGDFHNEIFTQASSTPTVTGGTGLDTLIFSGLTDGTQNISLANVTGIEKIDLGSSTTTTYNLNINFDDVFKSDAKAMIVSGLASDDTIDLITSSPTSGRGNVTWVNAHEQTYDYATGNYYDLWTGSDRSDATQNVILLLQQNITVTQVAA